MRDYLRQLCAMLIDLSNDGFHTKRRKQNIENAVIDAKCEQVHFPHYRNTVTTVECQVSVPFLPKSFGFLVVLLCCRLNLTLE